MHNTPSVIAVFLFTTVASAADLHVSPQPLPGIPAANQLKTISDAARKAQPGDCVVIHAGTYREAIEVEASGTAAKPIRFAAAPGEHVVVTGADQLTDWRREEDQQRIFSTPWPHRFIGWNPNGTHPDDDYHRLIGRCEQVFVEHRALRQVLTREQLSRGTFFVDLKKKRLWVWAAENFDLSKDGIRVEASSRQSIWENKGAHVQVRGLHFRYAANMAQHGAVILAGDNNTLEDCVVEYTNASGLEVTGKSAVVRRCTFQFNGQLGFGACGCHNLLLSDCTIRGNNTKGWDRGWEAGGDKICLSRDVVIEHSRFIENRGCGLWFDIGNENPTVRNCLIADNEDAGIFYEISFGLHAHDNVIVSNGFDAGGGAWGAAAGFALSSSPNCRIERNLIVGNKEGFNYREQTRTTPRIGKLPAGEEPIWNHDQVICNNLLAYNCDAQCWGWFDISDGRHWPVALRAEMGAKPAAGPEKDQAREYQAKDNKGQPTGLTLEKLKLEHAANLYFAAPGQGLFNWGTAWGKHREYKTLQDVQRELKLETSSEIANPNFADILARDFRVPPNSPAIRLKTYPQGDVPDVNLGIIGAQK